MIGVRYWSTGIKVTPCGPEFSLALDFTDNGFCEADASEGVLRMRYMVGRSGLLIALETLIQDAERLGIEWAREVPSCPTVYVDCDGEHDDGDRPQERALANELARAVGWTPAYSEEVAEVG